MFASRHQAGQSLGQYLQERHVQAELILGLPRGGVVVAAEVARQMGLPLDVLIVRKIGHPSQREFAVGALAEPDVVLFDEAVIGTNPIIRAELTKVVAEEEQRLQTYQAEFHLNGPPVLGGKAVVLVDDGLATGATTQAAIASARKQNAASVVVAAPVASTTAVERLTPLADDIVVLLMDPDFEAVGRYYEEFGQTTDEEVLELLKRA
ncbi:MAG: phosphoribosyltransferase [Verrucomicrobia bacterium]|nr:MAG: phosphoribosyltransferase [Verrucomicrobiota bacterium]